MTPEEIGARMAGLVAGTASLSAGGGFARATVDVPPELWADAVRAARDELGCDFFDWLSAVDELAEGFSVVAHVWSTAERHGLLLRTRIPRDAPALDIDRRPSTRAPPGTSGRPTRCSASTSPATPA